VPRQSWSTIRRLIGAWWRDRSQFSQRRLSRTCPICGYHGIFISVGHPPRWDARCPQCGSRERHRLTHLWVTEAGDNKLEGKRILHFAPEKVVMRQMRDNPLYETADLHQKGVTHQVDITDVPLPDTSFDVVIAHHVLEHIDDDRQAMRELFRLLVPGGFAILTTPINASRQATYENPDVTTPEGRHAHFSAKDHKRYYGLDFADRLTEQGFVVESFRMSPAQEVTYGLLRDEWITIARKPSADIA
jgi:SAM-dependent methyltransferase